MEISSPRGLFQHRDDRHSKWKSWRLLRPVVVVACWAYLYAFLCAEPVRCETAYNACDNNSCSANSTCRVDSNVSRGYVCDCDDSTRYSGDLCNVSIENKICADQLCQNSATCDDGQNGSSFTCTCDPGYTGSLCESVINYCVDLPCNNGTCIPDPMQQNFTCQCEPGFTGDVCDTNIDDCINHDCANGATCLDGVNNYTCQCSSGWTGPRCETDIKECGRFVCQHGVCIEQEPDYFCNCTGSGYVGENCSVELNECEHNFCVSNTTVNCTNTEGDYECTCKDHYSGDNCSIALCDHQCQNNSTCERLSYDWGTQQGSKWECDCSEFYGGVTCELEGPCVNNPCNASNSEKCLQSEDVFDTIPVGSNYTCQCKQGWQGVNCSDDINECSPVNICQHGGTCTNTPGSFECNCTVGYEGEKCETDIDECAVIPCQHGGVCTQGIGSFTCNCSGTGFEGDTCSQDIDECELDSNVCNSNVCNNTEGSFTCQCGDQYLGDRCQHINPCSPTACQNGGSCNHTWDQNQGVYLALCTCVDGYQGSQCEQSPSSGDDDLDLAIIIGPVVGVILLIIIIGVIIFIMVARNKRATHGAYSPSRQETAGARVELGNVLKKPPEERLI